MIVLHNHANGIKSNYNSDLHVLKVTNAWQRMQGKPTRPKANFTCEWAGQALLGHTDFTFSQD
jgi:hypothetical protein